MPGSVRNFSKIFECFKPALQDLLSKSSPLHFLRCCQKLSHLKILLPLTPCLFIFGMLGSTSLFLSPPVHAQDLPQRTEPTGRFGQPPPITEKLPKTSTRREVLPPLKLEQPSIPDSSLLKVRVQEIRVVGSTVIPPEKIT